MKKKHLWMLVAILICNLSVTWFSSCTSDNDNGYDWDDDLYDWLYDLDDVALLDSGYVSYVDILLDIINDHSELESEDDLLYYEWGKALLDSYNGLYKANTRNSDVVDGEWGEFLGMKYVSILYKTMGSDGNEKELSELIAYPIEAEGEEATKILKNLIIGCHCTITSNNKRPTNFKGLSFNNDVNVMTMLGASQNCLVVVPDYEGYGSTSQDAHPFCNRDVTAQQVIDGAKAAVAWFEENVAKLDPNWKSVALGYSQGGAVAASVLSHYQSKNLTGLNVIGAVCGDGPYDPLATLQQYIKDDILYMPVAASLMLKGMVDTNQQMKALNCTYLDFVTEKFYDTGIFDWIQNKSFTVNEVQTKLLEYSGKHGGETGFTMYTKYKSEFKAYIPENITEGDENWRLSVYHGNNYCKIDQCLRPGVIEYFKNGTITGDVPEAKLKALEQALKENALTYGGWKPNGTPTQAFYFFHSTQDEVVPIINYENVKNAWGTNLIYGDLYHSKFGSLHIGTGAHFFLLIAIPGVTSIFDQKWTPGEKEAGS